MELHIEGHHTEVAPDLRTWITDRMEALNEPYQDIFYARVTLVKSERHRRGNDEVRLFLTLAGKTLSATRTGATLEEALHDVLDVIVRELDEFRILRRGVVKDPGPRPRGRIVRLFPERGYGFIETDAHREVYFHANAVHGMPFDQLQVHMVVDLEIEAGHQGPQASRVTLSWP
jgi:cold shock CspA family protein/ribosome-associated translation inhibitor RaiA